MNPQKSTEPVGCETMDADKKSFNGGGTPPLKYEEVKRSYSVGIDKLNAERKYIQLLPDELGEAVQLLLSAGDVSGARRAITIHTLKEWTDMFQYGVYFLLVPIENMTGYDMITDYFQRTVMPFLNYMYLAWEQGYQHLVDVALAGMGQAMQKGVLYANAQRKKSNFMTGMVRDIKIVSGEFDQKKRLQFPGGLDDKETVKWIVKAFFVPTLVIAELEGHVGQFSLDGTSKAGAAWNAFSFHKLRAETVDMPLGGIEEVEKKFIDLVCKDDNHIDDASDDERIHEARKACKPAAK